MVVENPILFLLIFFAKIAASVFWPGFTIKKLKKNKYPLSIKSQIEDECLVNFIIKLTIFQIIWSLTTEICNLPKYE